MAKLVAIEHVTLDGVIQAPARPDEDRRDGFDAGGWAAAGAGDPRLQQVMGERMGQAWSLLAGRITYEDLASVWPKMPRPNPIADALDRAEKFVVSNTLSEPLVWQNSTLLNGDGAEAVASLRRDHEETLVVFGSAALLQSLMPRGLVDEYVLQIHPIVLGKGRRLFAPGAFSRLELVQSENTKAGVIVAVYRRAGGAFA
jgi:dihydrofolate reductase